MSRLKSKEEYEKIEKPSFLEKLAELKKEYADVLNDEGIPLRPKVYQDPNRVIFEE